MSRENEKSLAVYEKFADKYAAGSVIKEQNNPTKAARKRAALEARIDKCLSGLPKHPAVLEIGSGPGDDIELFEKLGCKITPSDAAQSFLDIMTSRGYHPIKLNILTDEIPGTYDLIYSWRVLVHFTDDDVMMVLRKVYAALNPGGRYLFNVQNINGEGGKHDGWIDFEGEHNIGAKRFFHFWSGANIVAAVERVGFVVERFDCSGGDDNMRWINICAKKL